ncbi:MAG: hypothetical protein NC211_08985 [Alistipes senegalensis]|nr:hypothetical protein [Oxalobacter formigenes]MCM1281942.1 hypothetical protein [Alistipes senegalensis]
MFFESIVTVLYFIAEACLFEDGDICMASQVSRADVDKKFFYGRLVFWENLKGKKLLPGYGPD